MNIQNIQNVFLSGPYAPTGREHDVRELEVVGHIPEELNGALYRMVPNTAHEPRQPELYHWFDGDGMVTEINLRHGKASVRTRYVETDAFKVEQAAGKALYHGVNGGGMNERVEGAPMVKNIANVNVTVFADKLFVFCDLDVPHELRRSDLSTIGLHNFGSIKGPVTGHWKIDPDNGDLLFFGTMFGEINWYRADKTGKLLETFNFNCGVATMIHDFVVTKNYAIFVVAPNLLDVRSASRGGPVMVWDPALKTRIAVLNRRTFTVHWFDFETAWTVSHFLNAHEVGDQVIIEGNRAEQMAYPPGVQPTREWFKPAYPWRWALNITTGTIKEEQVLDLNCEFPRHNENLVGKELRYGYYAATNGPDFNHKTLFSQLVKRDVLTGALQAQDLGGKLTAPGEPVFVPREGAVAEDDGWIMNMWWDPENDTSELVIFNGQDFSGEPVARVKLGFRIPIGFHGNWVPDSAA